jgi:hypothetical protein
MTEKDPAIVKAKLGEPHPETPKPPAKPPGRASTLEVRDADIEYFKRRNGLM